MIAVSNIEDQRLAEAREYIIDQYYEGYLLRQEMRTAAKLILEVLDGKE